MQVVLEKRLTTSDRERHYVIIPKKYRKNFPASDVAFNIKINDEYSRTYVDNYSRLRLGSEIFNKDRLDEPNTIIIIEKSSNGIYTLRTKQQTHNPLGGFETSLKRENLR